MAYLLVKQLTEIEESVLSWGFIQADGNLSKMNFTKLYGLAASSDGQPLPAHTVVKTYASTWKNSPKVQAYLKRLADRESTIRGAAFQDGRAKGIEEAMSGGSDHAASGSAKDFTKPENQKELLNEIINTATDSKDKLDAVKVIISGQRDDRQAAKEQKQVRFYLAQRCYECPLYQSFKDNNLNK